MEGGARLREYRERGLLEAGLVRVGVAFAADWLAMQSLLQHARPDRVRGGGEGGGYDARAVAGARARQALQALGEDTMEAHAVLGIACRDRSAREVAELQGWGASTVAMAALRAGLGRIAGVYGPEVAGRAA